MLETEVLNPKIPPYLKGKMCPHLPFIQIPNALNPKAPNMTNMGCQGESCAIWDSCQGDSSPKALKQALTSLKDELKALKGSVLKAAPKLERWVEKLEKFSSFPGLGKLFGGGK